MRSKLLLAICTVAGLAACTTDQISAPPSATKPPPIAIPPAAQLSIVGTIVQVDGNLWLKQASATLRLDGAEVAMLRGLIGSEVEMRGTYDGDEAFIVDSFSVRMVDGMPAADGVLVTLLEGEYGLLMADQTVRVIVEPPAELLEHLGQRVWIAGPADERPVAFGVISAD